MTLCYLGLGSNLRTPSRQLHQAIASLKQIPHTRIVRRSRLYLSRPAGLRSQPFYVNAVVELHTRLAMTAVLHHCQVIERLHQRLHKGTGRPRTIDIDLLLYGQQTLQTRNLTIPHPRLLDRDFVLVPLLELSPNATLPNGKLIKSWLADCECYIIMSK